MTLELQGYTAVFDNLVYTKREQVILNGDNPMGGKSADLTKVVLPVRFTEVTEDQVVDYLRKKAEELRGPKLVLPSSCENHSGTLDDAIKKLPDQILSDLANEDEACLTFLRNNTPARALKEGETPKQYVHLMYGVLPSQIIEAYSQRGEIKDETWFKAALLHEQLQKDGFGQRWTARILLYDGMLPDEDEMFVLIRHCVDNSRTLIVNKVNYNVKEVEDVVNAFYEGVYALNNGLATPNNQIGELRDASEDALKENVAGVVMKFHEMAKQAALAHALQEKLGGGRGGAVPSGLVQ